jgi:hypothetical protein
VLFGRPSVLDHILPRIFLPSHPQVSIAFRPAVHFGQQARENTVWWQRTVDGARRGLAKLSNAEVARAILRSLERAPHRLPLDVVRSEVERFISETFKQWANYFDRSAYNNPARARDVWEHIRERNARGENPSPGAIERRNGAPGESERPPSGDQSGLKTTANSEPQYSLGAPVDAAGRPLEDTRRFGEQIERAGWLSLEVREKARNRTYEVASLQGATAAARDLVQELGVPAAKLIFFEPITTKNTEGTKNVAPALQNKGRVNSSNCFTQIRASQAV